MLTIMGDILLRKYRRHEKRCSELETFRKKFIRKSSKREQNGVYTRRVGGAYAVGIAASRAATYS